MGITTSIFRASGSSVARAALILSVVMSFPFAQLFELGGFTMWAPAILHFVVQGTVKVFAIPRPGQPPQHVDPC